jgi:ethanolamine transporter
MENIILWILAAGAVIGGVDLIIGNRFKLGEKFEEGLGLLGPTALSMVGILCLAPLLSSALEYTVAPLFRLIGLDSAMLGGILAIDMGGYQMAQSLAADSSVGGYAGILVSATLGCTVSFTIPLGVGVVEKDDLHDFFRGILIGLAVMPIALLLGGMLCKIPFITLLINTLPVIVFSALLILGLIFKQSMMLTLFSLFAKLIRLVSIIGLILGAVQYITGINFIPSLTPIEDSMKVVSGIGVVMLGSLPIAELLRRILSYPMKKLGQKYGLRDSSLTTLLVGFVSVTPALTMIKDMDRKGKTMNSAFIVCAASTLASHLGFTLSVESEMVQPLLLTKLAGGIIAAVIALIYCIKSEKDTTAAQLK